MLPAPRGILAKYGGDIEDTLELRTVGGGND